MLPGLRALAIAVIAVLALLIGAFALAAALRVAQENRSGQLRADLTQRSRTLVVAASEPLTIAPMERPAPLEANPVAPVEVGEVAEVAPVVVAMAPPPEPPSIEPPKVEAVAAGSTPPVAEPLRTEPPAVA